MRPRMASSRFAYPLSALAIAFAVSFDTCNDIARPEPEARTAARTGPPRIFRKPAVESCGFVPIPMAGTVVTFPHRGLPVLTHLCTYSHQQRAQPIHRPIDPSVICYHTPAYSPRASYCAYCPLTPCSSLRVSAASTYTSTLFLQENNNYFEPTLLLLLYRL
ncbi:hypothetical protein BD779DRAFT_1515011 [Infundibulicybe gibba]|nr:hypothetical protein BD779DRAFT_1546456 [Infundibulicybe gibba]KAF8891396.1 hypothetical protein BD779DRAFT_1515011 [Infundibulicybe gibba]